jgi:hypothetical protein
MEEQKKKAEIGYMLPLLILAALGALECFNHFRAGPFRVWVVTADELSRLTVRELVLQEREQEIAKAEELDIRMGQIAKQQDRDGRKLK